MGLSCSAARIRLLARAPAFADADTLSCHVAVRDNVVHADSASGRAEGGGVWNGDELSGPPVELSIDHSSVTHNTATGTAGIAVEGGGLFTAFRVTLTATRIVGNAPDQCSGC